MLLKGLPSSHLLNSLRRMNPQSPSAVKKKQVPTMPFHSPVLASTSVRVWQKEARYSVFFSSRVSFFQSPFSFSRSFWKKQHQLFKSLSKEFMQKPEVFIST